MREKIKYRVISKFGCSWKDMIIVQIGTVVHVMDLDEWKKIYNRDYLRKHNKKVTGINLAKKEKHYKKMKAS